MNATEKTTIPMVVINPPKRGTRAVFKTNNTRADFVFIIGEDNVDYVCGECGSVLCKNVSIGQITNIVFLCPKCGRYNEIV